MAEHHPETPEAFRQRARAWISSNLLPLSEAPPAHEEREKNLDRERMLQARVFDAGFAGIAIPTEYGGAGLSLEHQRVWAEELLGYESPSFFVVSIGMMLPTLLDYGTEAVKLRHIPRMLRGEEFWLQLLSEPSGGSDMAGALTRATREGKEFVINGSKMWSTDAGWGDYGLCLVRTDWDAPKHAGLAMIAIPLKDERVSIEPIVPVDGREAHFFMEYIDDVRVHEDYLLGADNEGWAVAQRLLYHERNATAGVGYGYGLNNGDSNQSGFNWTLNTRELAGHHHGMDNPYIAQRVTNDYIDQLVASHLADRINDGLQNNKLVGHWGSLLKLGLGIDAPANADVALAVAGADGVIWDESGNGGEVGLNWLRVRGVAIAGGSNEIQRNIVSERLLQLPREPGHARDTPFRELMKQRDKHKN